MKYVALVLIYFLVGCSNSNQNPETPKQGDSQQAQKKPKIAFTFDDGSTRDLPNYQLEEWNEMILTSLAENNVKALFFPAGSFVRGPRGRYILSSWNDAGHKIGNHTFSHPNFNNEKTTLDQFKNELIQNDLRVRKYSNFIPMFRFPFLKEGNTVEKRDGFREFLAMQGYKIGHVTIDASDWYVNSELLKTLKRDPQSDTNGYKDFYVQHLYDRACYYDSLSTDLTHRKIKHNLLLHHNLTSALFLDDLIQKFKSEGWEIIDAEDAFEDPVYDNLPKNIPAGESLIWAMAKETGKYDEVLRYPAEDSRYEEQKMKKLGL
jgi:peptidoglycan/xylan/chitin deacetylase (PgdA/CDA1 family)